MGNIKISSLTICKDEQNWIAHMLSFLRDVVKPDEIIIMDGGSVDETIDEIDIFKLANPQLNIHLYTNPMPHSFSEQRNKTLGYCTGNWVLHIDADETYSRNIEHLINEIREGKHNDINGFIFPTALLIKDTFHMSDDGGDVHIRLYQKKPEHWYVGAIHESISVTTNTLYLPNVALRHYSMLKNDNDLLTKGKRWEKWGEQSSDLGIAIHGETHFVDRVNNFKGKLYDVPKEWE
jgi:glycosyltransferase involved in cell wall biosynthesis